MLHTEQVLHFRYVFDRLVLRAAMVLNSAFFLLLCELACGLLLGEQVCGWRSSLLVVKRPAIHLPDLLRLRLGANDLAQSRGFGLRLLTYHSAL